MRTIKMKRKESIIKPSILKISPQHEKLTVTTWPIKNLTSLFKTSYSAVPRFIEYFSYLSVASHLLYLESSEEYRFVGPYPLCHFDPDAIGREILSSFTVIFYICMCFCALSLNPINTIFFSRSECWYRK